MKLTVHDYQKGTIVMIWRRGRFEGAMHPELQLLGISVPQPIITISHVQMDSFIGYSYLPFRPGNLRKEGARGAQS